MEAFGQPNKFTNTYRNPYQRLFLKFTQKKKKEKKKKTFIP